MATTKSVIMAAALFGLWTINVQGAVPQHHALSPLQPVHAPQADAAKFERAVARGELLVMGQRLDGSQVVAVRVEYVYPLDGTGPAVWVYARLATPLPVPGQNGCEVRGVRARLGPGGHIIESEAHVWSR